jgi:hypothetical protein
LFEVRPLIAAAFGHSLLPVLVRCPTDDTCGALLKAKRWLIALRGLVAGSLDGLIV